MSYQLWEDDAMTEPRFHPGQQAVWNGARRFNWLAAGRRWRKTSLAVMVAATAALRGEDVLWGAPTYDQVRIGWQGLKRAAGDRAAFTESRLEAVFKDGGRVIFRSLDNPDHARGHTAHGVIVDEAADVAPAAWHEVLRPMLISTNGWAWLLGTPKGRNWFWTEWRRAGLGEVDDAAAWQAPASGAMLADGALIRQPHRLENPDIPWSEMQALFQTMPERAFRQEILAEFIDDGGGVFRGVRAAAVLAPAAYCPRHEYVIGVDWGRMQDFTVFCVLDITTDEQVALERFNGINYALQAARLQALCTRWRPQVVLAESNSAGQAVIDNLQHDDIPVQGFTTTHASKQRIIDDLAMAFERNRLRLLDDPVQTTELEAYTTERLPGGLLRYGAPPGLHDDTVMALAIAWRMAAEERPAATNDDADAPELMRDRAELIKAFPGLKKRWEG